MVIHVPPTYSFGKMNLKKCKLNFMILQTNLANKFYQFPWNQVHYIDNQFNLNFQSISLNVVNMI